MIGKLRGILDSVAGDHCILDVGGVGYLVFASSRTLAELEAARGEVALVIETHVREDHIHLYGFLTEEERGWFRLLTGVQGVGAKMGLAILGVCAPQELSVIVAAQDITALTRAHGVGKKLAERIAVELKGKIPGFSHASLPGPARTAGSSGMQGKTAPAAAPREDAVSALVNLGYGRSDAYAAVARALQENGEASLDALIRRGLKELA